MEPTIRAVTAADLATVHRIEVGSYSDPWPRSIFFLMRGRAPDLFLVAEAEGEVIGYAIGEVESAGAERVGHVMNIAVAAGVEAQGDSRGGSSTSSSAGSRRSTLTSPTLRCVPRIPPLKRLYPKRGYVEAGQLPSYYRDEDGLAMEKPLT